MLLSFWNVCVLFWHLGAIVGPWVSMNTLCKVALKFALLVRLSYRIATGDDRVWKLVLIQLLRRFNVRSWRQRRRVLVAEEKKSEMRWQAAIIQPDAPPILAGYGGLHSHWLARHHHGLVRFFHLTRTNHVQLLLRDWERLQWREKKGFSRTRNIERELFFIGHSNESHSNCSRVILIRYKKMIYLIYNKLPVFANKLFIYLNK